jgi:uncharacterized protein YjbI with pentapeptide repeats
MLQNVGTGADVPKHHSERSCKSITPTEASKPHARTKFENIDFENIDFENIHFENIHFENIHFENIDFENAI